MDGALPLSLSWAEAISAPWQSLVKCFNKISIFYQSVQSLTLERKEDCTVP